MRKILILVYSFVFTAYVYTQEEADARAIGMALAQTAVSENTDAYRWNPANLGLNYKLKPKLTIAYTGFGFNNRNNIFSRTDYNKYNGRVLSEADKADIRDLLKGKKAFDFNGSGAARALSVQYKNYAVNFEAGGNGNMQLPREILDVVFAKDAYEVGSENLSARGKGGGMAALRTSLSAGFPLTGLFDKHIREIAVGATLTYMRGIKQVTIKDFRAFIAESDSFITGARFHTLQSSGGNGFSLSFGVSAQINKEWFAGISVIDVYSKMQWKTLNEKRVAQFDVRSEDIFNAKKKSVDTTIYGGQYSTRLPGMLRAGVGYQLDKEWLLAGDIEVILHNAPGNVTPRIAVGAENHRWRKVILRSGLSVGGVNQGLDMALGAGFLMGKTILDVGTNNLEGMISQRSFSFALQIKTVF
ncbi:MAG TPA: hypothetical protein PLH27_04730 [bacterium]|nr:hypothetical protein [bacterium]HMY34714.1 hypothetical protein [bacterium]HMZ05458.1 hypothetical protein [bacterium]HNB08638.1 hypothetical protein [bacterium]HNB56630.1 hypothetical protein [bacterium]